MPSASTHAAVSAVSGLMYAMKRSDGQSSHCQLVECLGGAMAGYVGGLAPDKFEPAITPRHRSVGHGVLPMGALTHAAVQQLDGFQSWLRTCATEQAAKRTTSTNFADWLIYGAFEVFLLLLSGACAGFVAGYVSHLALDAFTPASLPLLV